MSQNVDNKITLKSPLPTLWRNRNLLKIAKESVNGIKRAYKVLGFTEVDIIPSRFFNNPGIAVKYRYANSLHLDMFMRSNGETAVNLSKNSKVVPTFHIDEIGYINEILEMHYLFSSRIEYANNSQKRINNIKSNFLRKYPTCEIDLIEPYTSTFKIGVDGIILLVSSNSISTSPDFLGYQDLVSELVDLIYDIDVITYETGFSYFL